jgi:hypothetical protein
MTSLSALRAIALATALAGAATAQVQCFEPSFGALLGTGDDTLFAIQPIGFTFTLGSGSYTDMHISTNGKLYLSNAGVPTPGSNGCCTGSASGLVSGAPTISPWWHDLDASSPGGVYVNRLSSPTRTVITWDQTLEFGNATRMTFQAQLYASGEVVFYYAANVLVRTSGDCLVGLSPGGAVADPGQSDLSSSPSTSVPTAYQLFNSSASPFDLANNGVVFAPNLGGGYDISAAPCIPAASLAYGAGCSPGPCAAYELFTAGIDVNGTDLVFTPNVNGGYDVTAATGLFDSNLGTDLVADDDSLHVNNALGFSFPYCGTSTSAIDVCSNGFVWLQTGAALSADFSESIAELVTLPDRIAVLWDDYDAGTAGTVHFNAVSGKAIVTWNGVTEFSAANANTFQLQLFPDGHFVISVSSVVNADALIGYAAGAPGTGYAADLSATPFYTGAQGPAVRLAAQSGSRPIIGGSFNVDVTNLPGSTAHVAWMFGFAQASFDLTPYGIPNCALLHTNEAFWFGQTASSPSATMTLAIPPIGALAGAVLQSQVLVLDANPLLISGSNGLSLTFGGF